MEFLGRLIWFLDSEMTEPEPYGLFHLIFFALSILGGMVLCRVNKKGDEKFVRKVLLVVSAFVILFEVYKQINFSFTYNGQAISFDYSWYAFPFQFCSTPMYVGLLAGLVRKGKVHDALCAYMSTFVVFAGLAVMAYPVQVFVSTIGINVQTMVCHGVMITVGISLLYTGSVKIEHKTVLKAIPVFAVCVTLAMIMNEIAYRSGLLETETFNMFFISPYCDPSLPVYSLVQAVVPFPFCLILYIGGFGTAAYLIVLMAMMMRRVGAVCKALKRATDQIPGYVFNWELACRVPRTAVLYCDEKDIRMG